MLNYDFMINAFIAGSIVAIMGGAVGFFLVMRGQSFAGHALSHVGFAGATGAVLLGIPPLSGLIALTLASGIAMGVLSEKLSGRDVAIGMILSLSLGFGLLFLHFFTSFATQATTLLFGNVLSVDKATLFVLAVLGVFCLGLLGFISRPLLFATLQPELAEAKGVSLRKISILFLAIVALAVAACSQIVGVLLVFTLLVGPASASQQFTTRVGRGIALSILFALTEALCGIALAYWTDWPSSFWITILSALFYLGGISYNLMRTNSSYTPAHAHDHAV